MARHRIEHDLEPEAAKRVAEAAWSHYSQRFAKYEPTLHWETDQRARIGFSAKGVKLKGVLELTPGAVEVDLDVPFLLRPFKQTAINAIEREFKTWIAKHKAGEL